MGRVQDFAGSLWEGMPELPLLRYSVAFIAVNMLDIVMTMMLLGQGFTEGNPLARMVIDQWGLEGMIAFKFSSVLLVCLISQIIATTRLETARGVLRLTTVMVLAVVTYSMVLYATPLCAATG